MKHLAPYLPYELKAYYQNEIYETGLTNFFCFWSIGYKPILEPLSNLTKPITRNGVTFVPIEWFENDVSNDWFDGNIWVDYLFRNEKVDLDFIPYGMVQQLIEWKFDIFDLIGQGKAIAATNEYN